MKKHRYYQVEQHGDSIVARIVDAHLQGDMLAEFLKLELLEIVDETSPTLVVVDFANVKLIGSLAVSAFLLINQRLSEKGIFLKLCSLSDSLREVFRVLRLDESVFRIYSTPAEALNGPHGSPTYGDICGHPTPFDAE